MTDIIIWFFWPRMILGYAQLDEDCIQWIYQKGIIISREWIRSYLREYHEGIIALSACLAGEVQRDILTEGLYEEAKSCGTAIIGKSFGEGNYLSGASGSWHAGAEDGEPVLCSACLRRLGIELVATNDVHYTYAEDAEAT